MSDEIIRSKVELTESADRHDLEEPLLARRATSGSAAGIEGFSDDQSACDSSLLEEMMHPMHQLSFNDMRIVHLKVLLPGFVAGFLAEICSILGALPMSSAEIQNPQEPLISIQDRSSFYDWSKDLFFHESSALFVDLFFFVYVLILMKAAFAGQIHPNLAFKASNWFVGTMSGMVAATTTVVDIQPVLKCRYFEIMSLTFEGILLCFATYATAWVLQCHLCPPNCDYTTSEGRDADLSCSKIV